MKWFEGSIGEAVSTSKTENAFFVVYVEGNDEISKTMTAALDSTSVSQKLESKKFVCIKLLKDSEGHTQFSEIYKIVPVPSLFFIGENGMPLEVVPGDDSQETVSSKISTAVSKVLGEPVPEQSESMSSVAAPVNEADSPPEAPVSTAPAEQETSPSSQAEADSPPEAPVSTAPAEQETSPSSQVDVEELLKKKREEVKKKEEEREKEAELRRRQQGQELATARKRQQERELDELRKEREREKKEEAAARERVLRQIQEDRAARLARQQPSSRPSSQPEEEKSAPPAPPRPPSPPSNSTRIQFKLPDSSTRTNTFLPSNTIQDLRNYVDANITLPFKEYTLATTFPRREFTARDLDRDLTSLELVPSGVILIMPLSRGVVSTRPNWASLVWAMFMDLIQPLFSAGRYLRSFVSGSSTTLNSGTDSSASTSQQNTASSSSAAPNQTYPPPNAGSGRTVRKRGNIHTLHDGDDSNDENNTWNGNSTQLM